jgi:dodecin
LHAPFTFERRPATPSNIILYLKQIGATAELECSHGFLGRRYGNLVQRASSDSITVCRGRTMLVTLRSDKRTDRGKKTVCEEAPMVDSVYKVIELVGTSPKSWEDAAKAAVDRAGKSLRDLRVAEVVQLDMQLDDGKIEAYRAKIKVSFKYEGGQ